MKLLHENQHVLHIGSLKAKDRLVVISHNKNIGLIPVTDQHFNQCILRSTCILVFIHQHILELFLVLGKDLSVVFENTNDPVDHVIKVVPLLVLHHFLELLKFLDGSLQLGHLVFFGIEQFHFQVAGIELARFSFIDVFIPGRKVVEVCLDGIQDQVCSPALPLHAAEQLAEVLGFKIYITAVPFQRMVFGKLVDQFPQQGNRFQIGDGFQAIFFKIREVILDDLVAEGMIGMDVDLVSVWSNHF